jgi:chemotaxis protein MotA
MNNKLVSVLCLVVSFGLFLLGALDSFGVYRIEALGGALNLASLFVILGGSFFQTFISFPTHVVLEAMTKLKPPFLQKKNKEDDRLESTMNLLRQLKADKQGTIQNLTDGQAKGFRLYLAELLSTNYNTEEIRILGHHKIHTIIQKETLPLQAINILAASSPAYGMLGTLMGLIVMLSDFTNYRGLALALALALMTTFYGLLMSQFVWQPLSKKVSQTIMTDQMWYEVELEGVILTLENKAELYILDQLSAMSKAKTEASV